MAKFARQSILKFAVIVLTVGPLFSSCLKEGDDTIVIPLPDGKIPYSVIPKELQDSLTNNGFIINEGITPPNIEGIYQASPFNLHYASDDYENLFYNLTMTFREQKRRGMITYAERQRDTVEGASIAAQVIGHDSCFTMYCYQNLAEYSNYQILWNCRVATIISGTMTPAGIKNYQYAYILLDKEATNDFYYSMLADTNTFRIYTDGDNIATKLL